MSYGISPFKLLQYGSIHHNLKINIVMLKQDTFMPMSAPEVRAGVEEMVAGLGPLLRAAVGAEGMLHEISCIVADPQRPR